MPLEHSDLNDIERSVAQQRIRQEISELLAAIQEETRARIEEEKSQVRIPTVCTRFAGCALLIGGWVRLPGCQGTRAHRRHGQGAQDCQPQLLPHPRVNPRARAARARRGRDARAGSMSAGFADVMCVAGRKRGSVGEGSAAGRCWSSGAWLCWVRCIAQKSS